MGRFFPEPVRVAGASVEVGLRGALGAGGESEDGGEGEEEDEDEEGNEDEEMGFGGGSSGRGWVEACGRRVNGCGLHCIEMVGWRATFLRVLGEVDGMYMHVNCRIRGCRSVPSYACKPWNDVCRSWGQTRRSATSRSRISLKCQDSFLPASIISPNDGETFPSSFG